MTFCSVEKAIPYPDSTLLIVLYNDPNDNSLSLKLDFQIPVLSNDLAICTYVAFLWAICDYVILNLTSDLVLGRQY